MGTKTKEAKIEKGKRGKDAKYTPVFTPEKKGAITRNIVTGIVEAATGTPVNTIEGFQNARKLAGSAEKWRNGVRAENATTSKAKENYKRKQRLAAEIEAFCNTQIKALREAAKPAPAEKPAKPANKKTTGKKAAKKAKKTAATAPETAPAEPQTTDETAAA